MKYKTKNQLITDQKGIASMVIVILIMTFLTLIVLSMTKNASREQRQSLDRQLETQAFYAAESGISDAKEYLKNNPGAPDQKTDCDNIAGPPNGNQFGAQSSIVGTDPVIGYSCVLYDKTPIELPDQSSTTESMVAPIEDAAGGTIKSILITWHEDSGGPHDEFSACPASTNFPPTLDPNNCEAGALRVELTDISSLTTRDNLIQGNFLAYILPRQSAAPVTRQYGMAAGSPQNQGQAWSGACTAAECSITIDNINKTKLLLHLRSIYKGNIVTVSGKTNSGSDVHFKGAQVVIDSTGRANDDLKRIRVAWPLSDASSKGRPEFALETTDGVCKLLNVLPDPNVGNSCPH